MFLSYLLCVLFLAIGFGISVVLAIRVLSNPIAQGRNSLMVCIISVAIWTFGYAMEMVSAQMEEKLFWAKVQYLGITFACPGIFWFTLEYTGNGKWLTATKALAISIIPTLTIVLAFANDKLELLWTSVKMISGESISPLILEHGPAFYINLIYTYLLLAISIVYLIRTVLKAGRLFRNQAIVMLIGMLMPWVGNIIYVTKLIPLSGLDITPIMLTFTNITFLIGFLRVRLLDIIPIAQDAIFRSMNEAVIVLDEKERVLEINPAAQRIFIQSERYIGAEITALLPEWSKWVGNNQKLELELNISGRVFFLRTDPIMNNNHKHEGQLVILNDVTERTEYETRLKEAHAQAVAANQAKTQLLANVSHDLRTPLNAIMGYTEMLHDHSFGSLTSEQENATAEILDSSNKLLVFINNFISQAQIETGKILIKARPFSPSELVEDIRSMVKFWAHKKGLGLSYDIDAQLPEQIMGDPYWLKQILLNLVNNALKFTDTGGVYVLITQKDEHNWSLAVRDTGIGIPPEAQNRIFEAYQQAENANTRKSGGSGLGLSIVCQLVSLMHGQITIESAEGQGSTFTITLPLVTITQKPA